MATAFPDTDNVPMIRTFCPWSSPRTDPSDVCTETSWPEPEDPLHSPPPDLVIFSLRSHVYLENLSRWHLSIFSRWFSVLVRHSSLEAGLDLLSQSVNLQKIKNSKNISHWLPPPSPITKDTVDIGDPPDNLWQEWDKILRQVCSVLQTDTLHVSSPRDVQSGEMLTRDHVTCILTTTRV